MCTATLETNYWITNFFAIDHLKFHLMTGFFRLGVFDVFQKSLWSMEWIWFVLSVALGALLMVGAQVMWITCYIQGAPEGGPPPSPPPVPKVT